MRAFLTGCVCVPLFLHAQEPAPTPQWRPVYHYTPLKNWTNDPNGLIYLDGKYLLYNQYNPFDYKWGHMSWGHAVSRDLVHWDHLPVAIPEIMGKDTVARFSGSAVWDKNNTSGFCTSPKGCLVAIYTADQPAIRRESQFIAYSNDGGLTFTNYDKNPVIDLHMRDFRDPNVIWLEREKKWLMTVAVPGEHKVRFYGSRNLKDWELLSEFGGDQGDTRRIWECPSLTPMGDAWLLMVSSGNPDAETGMQYFVGDFDGRTFTNRYPAENKQFVDYGSTYYAAIPWNNLPPGQHIMLGWLTPTNTVTYPWTGQMSIPRDIALRHTPEGVKLFQTPSAVISSKLGRPTKEVKIEDKDIDLGIKGNAWWIDAKLKTTDEAGFAFAGKYRVAYDRASGQLVVRENGTVTKHMDVHPKDGVLHCVILLDKSSLEIFADDGARVLTTMVYPDTDGLSLYSKGSTVGDLKVWNLAK